MLSSLAKLLRSSSRSTMDGCRMMMLLMVVTGDRLADEYEFRLLLARDEADDDRRNEVRRLWGLKRAVMAWKRADCIFAGLITVSLFFRGGEQKLPSVRLVCPVCCCGVAVVVIAYLCDVEQDPEKRLSLVERI